MPQGICHWFFTGIFLLLLLFSPAPAAEFEVVTTIPSETLLDARGTRRAADVWVEMIAGAKERLDFAQFYLATKPGERLEPVIDAVIAAAGRGVKVRFLVGTPVNDGMKVLTFAVVERLKKHSNIDVTMFNWKELTGGILHAKYFIVDGAVAYLGSQNFDWRALKHIHETGLLIKEKHFAQGLTAIFEADWRYNNGDKDAYKGLAQKKSLVFPPKAYLVSSPGSFNPPGVKSGIDVLLNLIDKAKKHITVQLLDYSEARYGASKTYEDIGNALSRAAGRGVRVRMLVSDWNKRKPKVDSVKKLAKVPNIQVKFVTIPQSKKAGFIPYARVIHSKVMRIDDTLCWVGTSNWGYGYFYSSRNVEAVVHDPPTAKTLDRLFQQLWTSPYAYPVEADKEYAPPKRK